MVSLLSKIVRTLKSENRFQRMLQAANKSPIRHMVKIIAVAGNLKTYLKRKRLVKAQVLTGAESQALAHLNDYGFAELSHLIDDESLQLLYSYGTDKIKRSETINQSKVTKSKDFWVLLSDEDVVNKTLTTSNPIVATALNENLLNLAGAYLKQAPFLEYVVLTYSTYMAGELKSSQLWHLDRDDTKMLKLFIYLTDVKGVEDGPFTFINKSNSRKIRNGFFMNHLDDRETNKYVNQEDYVQMIRPKLSSFIVDTSRCYHMGSRLYPNHSRLMYTALFTTLPPIYPWAAKEKIEISSGDVLSDLQISAIKV